MAKQKQRTTYRNGDDIGLVACGCDGCKPSRINGVLCHETGCKEAWRDYAKECEWCGSEFYAQSRFQSHCSEDCAISERA